RIAGRAGAAGKSQERGDGGPILQGRRAARPTRARAITYHSGGTVRQRPCPGAEPPAGARDGPRRLSHGPYLAQCLGIHSLDGTSGSEGLAVRVVPCMIVAAALCLSGSACSHTNKRPAGGETPFTGAGPATGKAPTPTDPLNTSTGPSP